MIERPQLDRVIGIPGVAFAAFNGIVGMGIFALPGLVAGVLGPSAIFAYLLCLLVVSLVGLCMAEAGSRVRGSGGLYAYAGAAFGPIVGGIAGALLVTANTVVSAAAVVRFLLDTLAAISPLFATKLAGFGLMAACYALLVLVNIRGARGASRLNVALSLVKLAPLVLLVFAGLYALHPRALAIHALPGAGPLGNGALLLFFAFQGIENGTFISGEIRDPARTIPRAVLLALTIVAALYIGLQTAAQGVLGPALANAPTPFVDLARAVFGPWGGWLVTVATLLSLSGFIVSDILTSSRIVFALAASGQLPRLLARIHPRHHTPWSAIVAYPIAILLVTATGTFRQIAILSSAGTLALYLITCLGVLRLRAKGIAEAGAPFIVPGGPWIPLIASGFILWLLATLSWQEMAVTAVFMAAVGFIFALRERGSGVSTEIPLGSSS